MFIDSERIKDVFTTGLYINPGGAGGVCGGGDGFGVSGGDNGGGG